MAETKTDLLTEQLGKNGLLAFIAIFASVIVFLYFSGQKANAARLKDKDKQLDKSEIRLDKKDTLILKQQELLGAKKVIDSLNK